MTPGCNIKIARKEIGWHVAQAAAKANCSPRLWRHWEADDDGYPIPPEVLAWIKALADAHKRTPAPAGWKRRVLPAIPLAGI
jgi:hypothetical protein